MSQTVPEAGEAGIEALERVLQDATREALASEFAKFGIAYGAIHPTIRAIMEAQAISSGNVSDQVASFVRVARLEKGYALVKAYDRHAETLREKSSKILSSGGP